MRQVQELDKKLALTNRMGKMRSWTRRLESLGRGIHVQRHLTKSKSIKITVLGFFEMPQELRNMIYKMLLIFDVPFIRKGSKEKVLANKLGYVLDRISTVSEPLASTNVSASEPGSFANLLQGKRVSSL